MDAWTEKEVKLMKAGGNDQCNTYLCTHGVTGSTPREKYDTPAAQLYKQVLLARIEGRPEPTQLTVPPAKRTEGRGQLKKKMEGFGSAPPPKKKRSGPRRVAAVAVVAVSAVATGVWVFMKK